MSRLLSVCAVACTLVACGSTTDELGTSSLRPLSGPDSYPNTFRDLLGKSDSEIRTKLRAAYTRLFEGDPDKQAIYFEVGDDQAYIRDILHDDIRTEGMALGMMIAVQLNEREVFDKLWTYAKKELRYDDEDEASFGYFASWCDTADGPIPCIDPFGHQQFVMALMFANNRWGSGSTIDYGADARDVLHVMLDKEAANGGIVDDITDMFDDEAKLPYHAPLVSAANQSRPSIAMPAYYELWSQATGDAFWSQSAVAAREYWRSSIHPVTGLAPTRADFDGHPVVGGENFQREAYRVLFNIAIDHIWFEPHPWHVETSNRLLQFFLSEGIETYGASFRLDGTVTDPARENALIVTNGVVAHIATIDESDRREFVQTVWDFEVPEDVNRYYVGLLDLMALLILSGQYRVY